MAVVPAVPTVTGGVYTSSQVSQLAQVETYLLGNGAGSASAVLPIAQLRQDTGQNLTTGAFTPITFDAFVVDSVNGHSNSVNNSRYTAVYAGWYEVGGGIAYVFNATGTRFAEIAVNGTAMAGGVAVQAISATGIGSWVPARTSLVYLNVGDYVEIWGRQDTGGTIATDTGSAPGKSSMTVIWRSN